MSTALVVEPAAVETRTMRTKRAPSYRDREGLLRVLDEIDQEGWDGAAAGALLAYVRATVVLPNVDIVGMWGPAADQAEATAWEAAWEVLASPRLRTAVSPWGILWTTARRAVLGELMAGTYCTGARTAWRLAGPAGRGPLHVELADRAPRTFAVDYPVSLEDALGPDGDLSAAQPAASATMIKTVLAWIVQALVDAGWLEDLAALLVKAITLNAGGPDRGPRTASGWRHIAADLDLPPWQVRRATVLVLGTPAWPGLVERLTVAGPSTVSEPDVASAIASTLDIRVPSPGRSHPSRPIADRGVPGSTSVGRGVGPEELLEARREAVPA